jgi:hypothetical protein
LETWAIRPYAFMAFASSYVQPENSSVYKYGTGGKKEMYMNLLHPLCRLEQRSFSSSVSCSKELTCLRNMGESSSFVKAAMSVLVSRGGEAAAALSKLEEIWAGGRREEEGGGGRA